MSEPIVIDAHGRHAQAVRFTKDSKTLVSVGQDARVRLWKAPSFEALGAFEGHEKCVNGIAFAPDEKRLATWSSDGTIRLWSYPRGTCEQVLEKQLHGRFSPDGQRFASINGKMRVQLWDAGTWEEQLTLPAIDKRLIALEWSPDGRSLLVAGSGPIHLVDVEKGDVAGTLAGHQVIVASLRLSPDGKLLASAGAEGSLKLWSTKDWSERRSIALKAHGIFQLAFSPKGDEISVSADGSIQTFSTKDGKLVDTIALDLKGVYGIDVSPDGKWLALAAADGRVRVWKR